MEVWHVMLRSILIGMRIRRVAHVNLSVDDVDAAARFYGQVMGLSPAARPSDAGGRAGCWFRLGEVEVHLSAEPGAVNAQSRRHVAFEVDDIGEARRRFEEAGYAIEEGRPVPGVRRFFVRDPAGNRLEFYDTNG
jgi:catechol 2,3-dioxygenase-like lactoylglutathione lyase family enzyme